MTVETKRVLFHLPADLLAAFDAHCSSDGRKRSETLRALVASCLGLPDQPAQPVKKPLAAENAAVDSKPARPIFFRLTAHEAGLAMKAAAGYRSIAAWVTALVRRELLCTAMISDDDRKLLVESNAQLRRIGINLNQIAHRLNVDERSAVTDDEVELLQLTASYISSHSKRVEKLLAQSQRSGVPNE